MMRAVVVDFSRSRTVELRHLGKLRQLVDSHGLPVRSANQYLIEHCTSWSQNTIRTYVNHLCRLARWVEESNLVLCELSDDHLARYAHSLAGMKKRRAKASTCIAALRVARNYLSWSEKDGAAVNPNREALSAKVLLRSARSRLGILDEPLVEPVKFALLPDAWRLARLMSSSAFSGVHGKRNELIARLMFESGLRVAEVATISVESLAELTWDNGMSISSVVGKGQKRRFIEVPQKLLRELHGYIEIERARTLENARSNLKPREIFLGELGLPISTGYIQQLFRMASRTLKLQITPHTLRHTYATYHYLANRDIVRLQKLLGHSDIRTTSVYVGIAVLSDQSESYQRFLQDLEPDQTKVT